MYLGLIANLDTRICTEMAVLVLGFHSKALSPIKDRWRWHATAHLCRFVPVRVPARPNCAVMKARAMRNRHSFSLSRLSSTPFAYPQNGLRVGTLNFAERCYLRMHTHALARVHTKTGDMNAMSRDRCTRVTISCLAFTLL